MKLKPIPQNTVVYTSTKEEARELLAILHENGWVVREPLDYVISEAKGISIYPKPHWGWWEDINNAKLKGKTILTLAQFKKRYLDDTCTDDCSSTVQVQEEKPQPKFKVGDRVKVVGCQMDCIATMAIHVGEGGTITRALEENENYYKITCDNGFFSWREDWLKPYTEPETKDEAKEAKGETKELSLCEILKEHVGEEFFSLAYGVVVLEEIRRGTQRGDSPDFLCVRATSFDSGTIIVNPNGKLRNAGVVDLVSSRALYEQYPLEPLKAWSVWQEEQKNRKTYIQIYTVGSDGLPQAEVDDRYYFRTADRDKCIEEIKAIIDKYRK